MALNMRKCQLALHLAGNCCSCQKELFMDPDEPSSDEEEFDCEQCIEFEDEGKNKEA